MTDNVKKIVVSSIVALTLLAGSGVAYAAVTGNQNPVAAFCGVGIGPMLGRQNMIGEATKVTGLTAADIQAARLSGKSIAQVLTEKGKDVKAFIALAVADRKVALDALVASGKITRAQADLSMTNFQSMVEANINRTTTGPNGARGGFGGMGGTSGTGRMMGGRWTR